MKDHVKEVKTLSVYDLEGDPAEVSASLLRLLPEGAIDPHFTMEYEWDNIAPTLTWWRPMTERELEKASNRRKAERAAKKAAKEKKEAEERAEYDRLKKKYEKGGK